VSGCGISWAICKSAPCSTQITMPVPHSQFFTGRMPFLPPNQQHQSTEGAVYLTALQSYIDNLWTEFANYNKCKWLLENCSVHKCVLLEVWNTLACCILAVAPSLYRNTMLTVHSVCKPNFTQTHVRTTLICMCCCISDIIIFRVIKIRLQFRSHKGSKFFCHFPLLWLLAINDMLYYQTSRDYWKKD